MTNKSRIDVHHHIVPLPLRQEMERRGLREVAGAPLPVWSESGSLDVMGATEIASALLSVSAPGVHFGNDAAAITLARACNEFTADVVQRQPERLGMLAVLPMPLTEASCVEAIYALEELKADGVVLLGSVQGHFLGDQRFEELMVELDKRKAIVFLHPNLHPTTDSIGLEIPEFVIEFLCDTTRASLNLILCGVTERYPGINWILAHAGGFLPYIAWRASILNSFKRYEDNLKDGVLGNIQKYYYDTALSPASYPMAALGQLVDPSHILFGSDFPFAPAPMTGVQTRAWYALELWTEETRLGVERKNALNLFPRFGLPGEEPGKRPEFRRSMRSRIKTKAMSPIISLLEAARNR